MFLLQERPLGTGDRMTRAASRDWQGLRGLGVMVAALLFAAMFPHEEHALLSAGTALLPAYFAVIYASFSGGTRSGLLSAFALVAFIAVEAASPGPAFGFGTEEAQSVVVYSLTAIGSALLVGSLKLRSDRNASALAAESQRRAVTDARQAAVTKVFDSMADAVFVSIGDGTVSLWNPAAEAMFGWSERPANLATLIPDLPLPLAAVPPGGAAGENRMEFAAPRESGEDLVVDLTVSSLSDALFLVIMRDVTERVRLVGNLAHSNAELVRANERLEAFSYLVAHDLKEPVRGIAIMLESLQEDCREELTPDHLGMVEAALRNAEKLDRLIRGLLELSRSSRFEVRETRSIHIPDLLKSEECVVRFGSLMDARHAKLEVDATIPPVTGHPGAVCQVLGNLISNSIRHNDHDAPAIQVYASTAQTDTANVEVIVADDGPGFPPEVIRKFETGRPGEAAGSSGETGSGFGLLIARHVIERMGGRMWLANAPGDGGRVHLLMPAAGQGRGQSNRTGRHAEGGA